MDNTNPTLSNDAAVDAPDRRAEMPFDWDDPVIYRWSVSSTGKDRWQQVYQNSIAYFVVVPLLLVFLPIRLLALATESGAQGLAWIVVGLVFFIWAFVLGSRLQGSKGDKSFTIGGGMTFSLFAVLAMGALSYLMAFPLRAEFAGGEESSGMTWFVFVLEQILRVATLDIPEVLDLRFTEIRPETMLSRASLVLFRLCVAAGLIDLAVNIIRTYFQKQVFHGTVKEAHYWVDSLPSQDGVSLVREGQVRFHDDKVSIPAELMVEAFEEIEREESRAHNRGEPTKHEQEAAEAASHGGIELSASIPYPRESSTDAPLDADPVGESGEPGPDAPDEWTPKPDPDAKDS